MPVHEDQGRVRLKIERPATIARAVEIRDQIATAAAEASSLEIELDDTEIDFAVLQIFASARRSMNDRGGVLTLSYPSSAPLLAMLAQGGFVQNNGDHQIWDVEVGSW